MKHLALFAVIGLALLATSCSVFSKTTRKSVTGAQATRIYEATPTPQITPVAPQPVEYTESQPVAVEKTQVTPTAEEPRQKAAAPAVPAKPVVKPAVKPAKAVKTDVASVLPGEWTIVQVLNTIIDRDDDMPYINFVAESGEFYANNGCNTLNGSFAIHADSVSFASVLATMRYCPDVKFDHDINTIIADGESFKVKITTVGNETFAEFFAQTNKAVLRLRRGNLDFLNGHWTVAAIAGMRHLETPADIFFDLKEFKLHGNTGCNFFNGDIYLDHRAPNAVDFSNMGVTRMACPYTTQETAMLVALEQTASAISGGPERVVLLDADGHELIILKRVPVVEDSDNE